MSDLLIKNCEMPTFCGNCLCFDAENGACSLKGRHVTTPEWLKFCRPDWCPLAELEPVYKKDGRRYIFAMWAEVPKHYPAETNTNKGKSEAEDAISLFKQLTCGVVFFCDPDKNTECSKEECFINGGPCYLTKCREFKKEIW